MIEPSQVPRCERLRRAAVDHHRVLAPAPLQVVDRQAGRRLGVVEQVAQPPVAVRRVREVQRRHRLALGHDLDERVLRHGLQGVVPAPLLADRRRHRVGHRLAARGARTVGGEDPRAVGQASAAGRATTGTAAGPAPRRVDPTEVSRSGRPTSPTNSASPVSTPHGTVSSACSHTTTEIDSGVCPGVWRTSSTTSPSSSRWPWASGSIGNSARAALP